MKIVIIDGQGGRLGKLLVEGRAVRLPQAELYGIGTNALATSAMLKAGADFGATGENPVVRAVADADGVLGPVGIVVANAIFGGGHPRHGPGGGQLPGEKVPGAHEQLRRHCGGGDGEAPERLCGGCGGGSGPGPGVTHWKIRAWEYRGSIDFSRDIVYHKSRLCARTGMDGNAEAEFCRRENHRPFCAHIRALQK